MRLVILLALLMGYGGNGFGATGATAEEFYEVYMSINRSAIHPVDRQYMPPHFVPKLKKTHVLFVSGYLNEGMPIIPIMRTGYWYDNIEALVSFGMPRENIHVLSPPSQESIEEAVPLFIRTLRGMRLDEEEQVIIISHSKGAVLSVVGASRMLAIPEHQEFVRRKIRAVVPIQMAAGSEVADYFYHYYEGIQNPLSHVPWKQMFDRDKYFTHAALFATLGLTVGGVAAPAMRLCGQLRGMRSITTSEASDLMNRVGEQCSRYHGELSNLFLSIGGAEEIDRMPWLLRPTGQFLEEVAPAYEGLMLPVHATDKRELMPSGKQDGLAVTARMTPSFLTGADACPFAILKMDHATPGQGRFVGDDPKVVRETLMAALMRVLLVE